MAKFYFHLDRKVSTWKRSKYYVEASSKEEATEKMIEEFNSPSYDAEHTGYIETVEVEEVEADISVKNNGGSSTQELYIIEEGSTNPELIYNNGM